MTYVSGRSINNRSLYLPNGIRVFDNFNRNSGSGNMSAGCFSIAFLFSAHMIFSSLKFSQYNIREVKPRPSKCALLVIGWQYPLQQPRQIPPRQSQIAREQGAPKTEGTGMAMGYVCISCSPAAYLFLVHSERGICYGSRIS